MAEGFLDVIRRVRGDGEDAGDEFGGGAGRDGSGLPQGAVGDSFMFATGIECSNPTIGHGRIRRDQLAETGHYDHWREDLHLVHDLGLCLDRQRRRSRHPHHRWLRRLLKTPLRS